MSALHGKPELTPERVDFYRRIDSVALSPLWETLSQVVTPEPKSPVVPHLWKYDAIRSFLIEAGGLITAKEAERRVLVLENPGLRGKTRITTSIYAGVQMVTPGEIAPAHRHSQSALRFVLEASPGGYTAVAGEKTYMEFGDFVITPAWEWHDHGNESPDPLIWIDGLDLPMVTETFAASFAEEFGDESQPILHETGWSEARYGSGLLPADYRPEKLASPIFNYRYARARVALAKLARENEIDPCHGVRMRYVNPVDGGWAMPTIGVHLQLLPKGLKTAAYRATDATTFIVTEGRGRSTIAGQTFEWGPRDIFVAPSWSWISHEADDEAVIFSFSDRAAQEKLGIFREDRGNH